MNIWINKYKKIINNQNVTGALLKFDFANSLIGYSCLQPWTELGDVSLDDQIKNLKNGDFNQVLKQVFYYAQIDAQARAEKVNLQKNIVDVKSHKLVSLNNITQINATYNLIKAKVGQNINEEIFNLTKLIKTYPQLRVRLDFNSRINYESLVTYLELLKKYLNSLENIDLIEDPCAADEEHWKILKDKFSIALAADRETAAYSYADTIVVKPVIQSTDFVVNYALSENKKIYFTSNLDHPLGVTIARYEASKIFKKHKNLVLPCGLNLTDASDKVEQGFGFGFDSMFNSLKWDFLI